MIVCRDCGQEKPAYRPKQNQCTDCYSAYMKEYNRKNRDRLLPQKRAYHHERRKDPDWVAGQQKRGREYWNTLRHEVIMAYGGYVCACCGEKEPKFLTIDHIFNDGAQHRREIGKSDGNGKGMGTRTWKWCKDHNFPAGFQVLCMNCNFGKARNKGVCPHNLARKPRETGEAQTG